MKNIFSRRGVIVLVIVLAVIIAMSILAAIFPGNSSPVSNVFGVIMSPFRTATSAISDFFGGIYSYINDFEQLKLENRELKELIAKMEEEVRESRQALDENERLRSVLELSEKRRDFEFVMANIVSRSTSNWESSFTISKGSAHGISAFDCVVDSEFNFVGYVSEVGTNWAVVSTLIDSGTELGAIIYRTQGTAVAEGDFTLMGQGKLKLTFLPENDVLLNGDTILTSGIGGVYPNDLVIGTVDEVRPAEGGLGDYAVISPKTNLQELTQIFIITSFDIME